MSQQIQKERDIEILEYRIEDTAHLIANYMQNDIPQKKIDKLEVKLISYQDNLAKIKAS